MFWGISESLDLYQEYLNALKNKKEQSAPKDNEAEENEESENINTGEENVLQKDTKNHPEENNDSDIQDNQYYPEERIECNGEVHGINTIKEIENVEHQTIDVDKNKEKESENDSKNKQHNEEGKEDSNERTADDNEAKAGDVDENEAEVDDYDEKVDDYEEKADGYEEQVDTNEEKGSQSKQEQFKVENEKETLDPPPPKSLNILILGAGDPRHLIKTIAKLYTHRKAALNFYILDGCVEIVARNILLLGIALENPEKFSLRNKVHLFMDIYGNALIRPASHHYLVSKSKTLLKMITDDEIIEKIAPTLNIDGLKYRERDALENAFNFWLPKDGYVFNMPKYWEARLRKHLGVRYDYRDGAFDWDLNMILKYREGKQICSQEYRYWRETGIAFTYPEYEQCKSNKTLSAGLVRNGEKYMHRGYVGDMEIGPFCTFGLRSKDERLKKSAHGENDYRSTDVTERNLLELFHEIQTQEAYEHNTEISRKYGAVRLQMGNRFTWNECDIDVMQEYDEPWLGVEGVKINFLSADEVFTLQDANERWRDFFDVAFVGHNYFTFIKSTFAEVLRANALLLMETKLMTLKRKEEVTDFEEKLKNYAKSANLTNVLNYNAINANFTVMKFRKQINREQSPA